MLIHFPLEKKHLPASQHEAGAVASVQTKMQNTFWGRRNTELHLEAKTTFSKFGACLIQRQ